MRFLRKLFFFLLIFSLPTQLGIHFWLNEALILGRKIDYLSPTLYLTDILFVIWIIFSVLSPDTGKQIKISKRWWLWWGIFISISLIISPVKITSLYFIVRLLEMWAFYLMLKFTRPAPDDILWPLGLAVIITVYIGLNQFYHQASLQGVWYYFGERRFSLQTPAIARAVLFGKNYLRPYSIFPHPNVWGGFLAVLLPIWLFYAKKIPPASLIFRQTAIALSVVGIGISFSRTAWSATIILIIAGFINQKKISLSKGLLLLTVLLIAEEIFIGRFINMFLVDQNSWWERQKLIQASIKMIQDRWASGVGVGGFLTSLPNYMSPPFLIQPVHSLYLMILTETGFIGLSLFFISIKNFLCSAIKNSQTGLLISLCLILFLGFFDHYFYTIKQTQWLFILIIGMISIKQGNKGCKII